MKVGPRSAGAKPGPVCYGLGGTQPTVTDADLVLGRLDPAYFLGGELTLDPGRVQQAFADTITPELGIESQDAALGVQRIVDETMAAATRMHLAEKGRDPRQYTIIAFGGAGPVHAWNLARLLKVRQVVVPLGAGVASALGFLVAPPATDMVRSYVARLDRVDWSQVNTLLSDMQKLGRDLLTEAGADPEQITYKPTADMRYVGQGFEVPVELPSLKLGAEDLPAIRENFFASYRTHFGRVMEGPAIEALSWRLACVAPNTDIRIGAHETRRGDAASARRGQRRVLFEEHGWQTCAVYDRYALPQGSTLSGPALIEERESTCVVGPGALIKVDEMRNLVIELG
jgi:N-methylhydantoinase A